MNTELIFQEHFYLFLWNFQENEALNSDLDLQCWNRILTVKKTMNKQNKAVYIPPKRAMECSCQQLMKASRQEWRWRITSKPFFWKPGQTARGTTRFRYSWYKGWSTQIQQKPTAVYSGLIWVYSMWADLITPAGNISTPCPCWLGVISFFFFPCKMAAVFTLALKVLDELHSGCLLALWWSKYR